MTRLPPWLGLAGLALSLTTWADGGSARADTKAAERPAAMAQRYSGQDSAGTVISFEPRPGATAVLQEFIAFATVDGQVLGFLGSKLESQDSLTIYSLARTPRGWRELSVALRFDGNLSDLRVTPFSLGPLHGVLFGNPTPSQGNPSLKFLVLEGTGARARLRLLEGSDALGELTVLDPKAGLATAYVRCGCADACWRSTLLQAVPGRFEVRGQMGCDCENFHLELGTGPGARQVESGPCPNF